MILTGHEIKQQMKIGNIFVTEFDEHRLNPNSYNLRLSSELRVYDNTAGYMDINKENDTISMNIPSEGYALLPGILYLARTVEYTETHRFVPMLEGRSSLARLGLSVHITAGFGDIGYCGVWTLEMSVIQPLIIYPNVEVAQIYYVKPCGDIETTYHGKYQGSHVIKPSKMYEEMNDDDE